MKYSAIRKEIYKNLQKEIPQHLKRIKWKREQILENQEKELKKLLKYVKANSLWYREKLRDIDPEDFSYKDISKLPILTKDDLMDNWNDIVCDKNITKEIAERHQEKLREGAIQNPYYLDNYLFYSTGGSSGKRGLFVWDKKLLVEYGCQAFRYEYNDGLSAKLKYNKVAVLTAPSDLHASTELFSLEYLDCMNTLYCPVNHLQPEEMCEKLNAYQPTHLIGFSSAIRQMALCSLEEKLNIHPTRVTVNSEPLDNEGFELIKKVWDLKANMTWGAVEFGIGAADNKEDVGMFLG